MAASCASSTIGTMLLRGNATPRMTRRAGKAARPLPVRAMATGAEALPRKAKVAVVGAGWGGFGAAKALVEAGCEVTLLDGIPVRPVQSTWPTSC